MTISALFAVVALLAQADPGPGEPPPAGPATATAPAAPPTAPAAPPPKTGPTTGPTTGPAEPAPPETGPAEPAPAATNPAPSPSPSTPSSWDEDSSPRFQAANTVAVLGGVAYRLTSATLGPSAGFSIGGSYQRRYAMLNPVVELGLAVDFSFDRFATGVVGSAPDAAGVEQTYAATRTITATTFDAMQTLGVRADSFHAWLGAGAGLAVGFFSSPELALRPGTANAYQPFARAAVGADVAINRQTAVGLRAGYTFMLSSSSLVTSTSGSVAFLGDLLDIQAGLFYRFR